MDTTSATSTPLSIKNILESVADARENLIQRLQGIEDNLNKKYGQKIDALKSDYDRTTTAEEEKYQKDRQKLIEDHPDDQSRLEELEKKHNGTLNSLQEKLKKEVHDVKSEAIEEIIGVISGTDSRLSKDDLTFSDLGYVLNQIKAELTINSAVKFLSEWHGNIQTLSKQLGGDTGFATKKYSELKTLLAKSEESAKKVAEGVSKVGESMADADDQFEEAFDDIISDFEDKIAEEKKTDTDLLKAIAIAHGGAEKSLEDLKKKYSSLDAAKNKNVEGALKKSIVEMLRTRHKGLDKNEEALDRIADVYIEHAKGRKELASAVGSAESGWAKAKKVRDRYIANDTAGGRLLKMILAGSKAKREGKNFSAGMLGSIKQDIRKDYDSFFYKDASGLLGNGRAYLGAFLESWLPANKKAREAEKKLQEHDEKSEEKIRQIVASAEKGQPSIGTGGNSTAPEVAVGKASGHAAGKRNIEDGIHVVGEKGAELLVKQGNSVSILQIKPDISAPASIGVSPGGAGQQIESSAEFERKQQETNDRHAIAENLKTIVEILNQTYELKKKEVNSNNNPNGGGLLSGLSTFLSGLIGGKLIGSLKRGFSKLGSLIMKPLAKIGMLISSSFRSLMNGVRSIFGMPKLPDVKVSASGEVPIKAAEGAKKGRFSGIKDAFKNFKLKNALKIGLKGLGKGLVVGAGIELLREGVARGTAKVLGLTPEEYEESRARVEDMEYGHGRTDDMLAEKSDAQAEDEQYEAYKRTSEMWYRKRCKELGIHHKTNQDSWFTSSKDYRELTYDEIMALNPREREYFNAWLHSKEGESKLAKLQREHPEVFGTLQKTKPSTSPSASKVKPSAGGPTAVAAARAAAMKARAKNPSAPTKEAKEAAKKMQETNLLPAGFGAAAALGAGSSKGSGASGGTVIPAAGLGLGLGLGAEINPEAVKEDTHHKTSNSGIFAKIKENLKGNRKSTDTIQDILLRIDSSTKSMQKNIDSICKMMRYIKVDGITLGDMLDHTPSDMRGAQILPGAGQAGAQIGAGVNQMPGGGQSWGAAPALGGPMQALDLPASGAFSGGKAENLNANKQQIANLVIAEAKRQGVDPRLALAIARQESNFNQNDISRAGAVGVMQIMPADVNDYGGGNVYNLNDNIRIGVTEIKKKLQLANGDVREALLRYNWGDGNVRSYKRRGTGNRGQQIPKEAREYADRVLGHIQRGTVANIMKASPGGEAAAMQGAQTMNPAGSPYTPAQQAEINANPMLQGVPQQGYPQGGTPSITRLLDIASRNARNAHGYSQDQTKRMSTHFDCSSFVGRSLREAGFKIPANLTTDKMNPNDKNVMSNEFTWVPGLQGMQPGDVMWRKGHTELYIGNGKTIGALSAKGSKERQVGIHPLGWGEFVGYWHPKPGAGQQGNQNDESMKQVPQQAPAAGPVQQNQQPESVPLYNPATGEQIKEPASPAPGGAPAPAGGGMQQIPAQQSPAIPGMPNMKGGPVQGLSSLYANLTRDAIGRHVTYGWNSKNSRSGSIDCSGWVTEMNKTALGGLSGQARTNMEAIVRGGQQGGAAGLIQTGEKLGFGIDGGMLDPKLGRVKENMMIGLSIGKHAKDRHKGIGHVVQTYRDPATGELMVSESTRGKGVISTKYADWYDKWKNTGLHAVDLDAATGGAFAGGNIQGAMQDVQQPDMGQVAGPSAGPQIQGSQQAQAQAAAQAYYASGGGGGNVYAPTTNVMGGGGSADKGGATFLTTKDPMSWIILQGNAVH